MYCKNCGAFVEKGSNYCANCGQRITWDIVEPSAEPESEAPKPVPEPALEPESEEPEPVNEAPEPISAPPQEAVPEPRAAATPSPLRERISSLSSSISSLISGRIPMFIAFCLCIAVGLFAIATFVSIMTRPKGASPAAPSAEQQEPAATSMQDSPSTTPSTSKYVPDGRTTPVGNLINGGYTASDDEWIFYAVPTTSPGWYTSSIGRMKHDGTVQSIIYHASDEGTLIWHLNVLDGRLYFNEDVGDVESSVVSLALDGTDRQVIGTCLPGTLCQVHKGMLYYMSPDGLTGYDPQTGDSWLFFGGFRDGELWRVWSAEDTDDRQAGDVAFFFEQGGTTLYGDRWNGGSFDEQTVTSLPDGRTIVNVVPNHEGLWILADSDGDGRGDEIYLSSVDGSQIKKFATCSGPVVRMNVNDRGIVLVVKTQDETRVEMITKNSTRPTVYYSGSPNETVLYPSVQDDLLFFGLVDTHRLVKVPLDTPGASPIIVA